MSELPVCCICLDNFTDPVSIPCGHRFCLGCIGELWRLHRACQCPLCKASFPTSPQLKTDKTIHGTLSEDTAIPLRAGEVPCDICAEKRRAVKSCLASTCLASYCETHLQPHYLDGDLWRHPLVSVAKNLEDSVCGLHGRPLDRFCGSDQTCICAMCAQTDHRGHRIGTIAKEAARKKVKVKRTTMKLLQALQERWRKVEDIRRTMDLREGPGDTTQDETRTQRAEGLIRDLQQEINELQRKTTELEELSHTEDHLHFLQVSVVALSSTVFMG